MYPAERCLAGNPITLTYPAGALKPGWRSKLRIRFGLRHAQNQLFRSAIADGLTTTASADRDTGP